MKPLTEIQWKILGVLRKDPDRPETPNSIAWMCGFKPGMARLSRQGRTMGPAVHVTPGLTGLRRRGLVMMRSRPDGLSGTAYSLTREGIEHYDEAMKQAQLDMAVFS